MIQITAIMENKASENKALINEHGLSFFIEKEQGGFYLTAEAESILFIMLTN